MFCCGSVTLNHLSNIVFPIDAKIVLDVTDATAVYDPDLDRCGETERGHVHQMGVFMKLVIV